MGLFNIFSKKENKADLDKGLEKTKEGVFSKLARAVAGKSKVDEEVLDNLEEILISSDVGVDTTVRIIERIEQRVAADKYLNTAELNAILRGLHFQLPPFTQSKLVRCVKGSVLDVAVDIRKGSPTYGEHVAVELSEDNHLQFFIPRGFAHGFAVLSEVAVFQYKCDSTSRWWNQYLG